MAENIRKFGIALFDSLKALISSYSTIGIKKVRQYATHWHGTLHQFSYLFLFSRAAVSLGGFVLERVFQSLAEL